MGIADGVSHSETVLIIRILGASRVPEFAVLANRTAVRQGFIEPQQVQRALAYKVRWSLQCNAVLKIGIDTP